MPEYLLYNYHTEYSQLPWKDLYPDQTLMNQFFNVRGLYILHTHTHTSEHTGFESIIDLGMKVIHDLHNV